MKQYKIDNGQIGGLLSVFQNSLVALAPFSFIGIVALNYDKYLKYWIDLNTFIIISTILFIIYEWLYFVFVFPSIVHFANRQACAHENPIYNDLKEIKKTTEMMESNQKIIINEIEKIKYENKIIIKRIEEIEHNQEIIKEKLNV